MRIAWFRANRPDPTDLLDSTAPVIAALRHHHQLDVITSHNAHDFVWQHFRTPYDVCVYEPGPTAEHAFMRAYQPHYPGIVAPLGLGAALANDEPTPPASAAGPLRLGLLRPDRATVVTRAVERAARLGAHATVITGDDPARILHEADVIVALEWPPKTGLPHTALLGMAAARPVIVLEVESTAGWPAFDPQTWQPRGYFDAPPVVVSLETRDEEHSLLLAIARLAADVEFRARLGEAGHAWWREHATLAHAERAWEAQLVAARDTPAPARTRALDTRERARARLAPYGVAVDVLG